MIEVTDNIFIDESEMQFDFMRAGGPGGQHVNKVSTAVQLRFDVAGSKLPVAVKARLIALAGNRITEDGVLIISARESRSRETNKNEAIDKLVGLIKKAASPPRRRIKTKASYSARQKRIDEKKVRGGAKVMRKKVKGEE